MPALRIPLLTALSPATRCRLFALLAAWPAAVLAQATPAVSTLAAFSGSQSSSGPIRGPDGALYGTTAQTSFVAGGLIYRLTPNGSSITTVYQLKPTDGFSPLGGLLLGSDRLLYGTTAIGSAEQANSAGTVFRVAADGSGFQVIHRFQSYTSTNSIGLAVNADGSGPDTELVEGFDGLLYGVTRAGGANGTGVVFKVARDGTSFQLLHAFGAITSAANAAPVLNDDGISPTAPLLLGADNYLYGTTSRGGTAGSGTIFRLRLDGTGFELLRTLPALVTSTTTPPTNVDGAGPVAGLTDGRDGRLYGVTSQGGSNGLGTVFALDPVGKVFTVLHNFDGTKGGQPTGELLLAQDGKLFGTTAVGGTNAAGNPISLGTIFSIARDGTAFTSLYSFDGKHGATPSGSLLQLDASTFVGVALAGGRCGQGTVYQFSLTGAEVKGVTNCGRRNNSGGGGAAPALLLLLAVAAAVRRVRAVRN
jgi:uncharacterized repeat protein (TIGR03803 family)